MIKPFDLIGIPFPQCSSECGAVELLGVGECENVCPKKFRKEKIMKFRERHERLEKLRAILLQAKNLARQNDKKCMWAAIEQAKYLAKQLGFNISQQDIQNIKKCVPFGSHLNIPWRWAKKAG